MSAAELTSNDASTVFRFAHAASNAVQNTSPVSFISAVRSNIRILAVLRSRRERPNTVFHLVCLLKHPLCHHRLLVTLPRPYGTDRISYPMWIFLPEETAYYLHCFAVPRGSDGEVLGPSNASECLAYITIVTGVSLSFKSLLIIKITNTRSHQSVT